jgi:glycosyltransferase involved in cell wall biosynthesis
LRALMSVLYLLTAPPPPIAGTDAVFQEVAALQAAFDGKAVNLSPLTRSSRRFPKQLFGFHQLRQIRELEDRCKVSHIFFPSPYAFPILRLLHNPVFYTVTGSLDANKRPRARARLAKLERMIVSNERDAAVLETWGLRNYTVIPPGIDTSHFARTALPLGRELTLLAASAPWSRRQFDLKGIDLLLAAVAKLAFLRVILLWRGVLSDELARRVERLGIGERVEIVDRKVDVNAYFARAHAAVLLAKDGRIVKSFPHSLIESLLAGKPVLLSETIAMADFVRSSKCGVVVRDMNVAALACAIDVLMRGYEELRKNTARIRPELFSIKTMVDSHRRLYRL